MKKITKHIVFITPGFPENEADTTCIPALQVYAKELQKQKNIQLSVITLHYPFTKTEYNWYNVKVIPLGFNNRKLLFKKSLVQKTLDKLHQQNPIHTLHSFWLGECALAGYRFSKKHSIKHICTLMGQDAKKRNKYAKILPLKKMNLITLSKFQQALFLKNYKTSSTIIPWGVSKELSHSKANKIIDIIGIGSLISLKNYTAFIQTIQLLKLKNPLIKAVLIGDGLLKEKLKKEIKKLKLEQNIELKGTISYAGTQKYLSQSKILLHPSTFESYGMVFAEALANNVFIVSKKVGFAETCNYWKTEDTVKGFFEECQYFLKQDTPNISSYPNVDTTTREYLKLYNL